MHCILHLLALVCVELCVSALSLTASWVLYLPIVSVAV